MREEEIHQLVKQAPGSTLEINLKELAECQCDELMPALGDAIAGKASLEILTVVARGLGDDAGQALVAAVAASPTLKLFVLRADELATDTILALASAVVDGERLEGLTISGTFPEDDDVGEAVGALASSPCLKALVLEGGGIGDVIGVAVATALRANPALRELSIHGDLVSDITGVAMAEALRSNTGLESLRLEGAAISDVGGRALAHALRSNASLVQVELTSHAIGDDTGKAFADILPENRTLRSLAVRAVRGSAWAASGCRAIAEALRSNDVLEVLEVTSSGPGDTAALADLLRTNRSLRCLTVHGSVRDDGCLALASSLQVNRRLAALHVRDTSLTKASAKALQSALRYNASLMWSTITLKAWPTPAAAAAMERNRDLPRCWRNLALLAQKSRADVVNAAVAAMTERGFRCSVFAFLLPRPREGRVAIEDS